MSFRQKPYFETKTCQIEPKVVIWTCPDLKSRDLDMSGPVQEDKYLPQNSGNTFIFLDFTPFHVLLANLSFFYKIISCTKRMYSFS